MREDLCIQETSLIMNQNDFNVYKTKILLNLQLTSLFFYMSYI